MTTPALDHLQTAPESMRDLFSMIGQKQNLKAGDVFVTEGKVGTHVYMLVSGSISVCLGYLSSLMLLVEQKGCTRS